MKNQDTFWLTWTKIYFYKCSHVALFLSETSDVLTTNMKSLVPILNEEDGHYQIGPEKACTEQFVLSVTIAYASNLAQVRDFNLLLLFYVFSIN